MEQLSILTEVLVILVDIALIVTILRRWKK